MINKYDYFPPFTEDNGVKRILKIPLSSQISG